ncbi:Tartrate-resistant acid phosphatase type 5 [Aphelenchoides fujianensis]|nr:Tartrate-resistant acid phosphatase type 5 [Aphelenchoides fujianensis]
MAVFSWFFAFFLLTSATAHKHHHGLTIEERSRCLNGKVCALDKSTVDVFVVGDTGGLSIDLTNTLGAHTTTKVQNRLAVSLAEAAERIAKPDFIINVGDNIYWNGVDNVNDSRFETLFEEPYADGRLMVPWYMIGGNHDHLGNISAQIEYSLNKGKWTFPNLFYKASYSFAGGTKTADFIFVDTIVMCGNSVDPDSRSIAAWLWHSLMNKKALLGPGLKHTSEAPRQWRWLEDQLRNSTADYIFVSGHYPIHSVSSHGPLDCLKHKLDPLLRKYNVSAYLAGHDHTLQHFIETKATDTNPKSTMHYIVSGVGSRIDPSEENFSENYSKDLLYRYPKYSDLDWHHRTLRTYLLGRGWGGYVRFAVGVNQTDVFFYAGDEASLTHKTTILPRAK